MKPVRALRLYIDRVLFQGAGLGTNPAIYSTSPILSGARVLPLGAMAVMLLFVRNTEETRQDLLNAI